MSLAFKYLVLLGVYTCYSCSYSLNFLPSELQRKSDSWENYYSNSTQLTKRQLHSIMSLLNSDTNFLVFDVGDDSNIYANGANFRDRTLLKMIET